mgnify:CR=1 FL=1
MQQLRWGIGDWELGIGHWAWEDGERETRGQGDKETRGQGDKETRGKFNLVTYYLLPTTYYLLPITYYLLPNPQFLTAHCSLYRISKATLACTI